MNQNEQLAAALAAAAAAENGNGLAVAARNVIAAQHESPRASPRPLRPVQTARRTAPSHISSCATRMNQRHFANYWSVENFAVQLELHQPAEFMLAPKFGDNDYEFVMKLFPNGKDEETAGYMSLFLLINKCPNPRLRFRVSFTVETSDGPRSCHLNKNLVTINRSGIVTASKFFSLDILKSATTVYTPNDTLTIGCELTIFGEAQNWATNMFNHPYARTDTQTSNGSRPCNAGGASSVQTFHQLDKDEFITKDDRFPEFLESGEFSDFTVVSADDREFAVHMCVLSARSDYFNALLRNKTTQEFTTKRVKFEDISGDVLAILLRHIYNTSNSIEKEPLKEHEVTVELITAVDRLMVSTMRSEVANVLIHEVTVENVVLRLRMAAELRLEQTYKNLLQFFSARKSECVKLPAWAELRAEKPLLTIQILEDALFSPGDYQSVVDRRILDRTITIN